MASSPASAQDTTRVMDVRGIWVEVPRPATTAGGSSAVEVSLDSLQALAAPTMEEFLRRMPLIQIRANSRGEAQPSLRGAEDRQIAVLLDGIPVTVGWDHRADLSIIPLTAVRHMTLLRGLSSMLHGPNVLGGAIEFDVARGAGIQQAPAAARGSISVDQEGGTAVEAIVGTRWERDFSSWVVRAGGGHRDRSGVPLPDGATTDASLRQPFVADADGLRLNSDRKQSDAFLSARYQGIGGAWFSGLATGFTAERGVVPEAHIDNPRLWRYPEQNRAFLAVSGGTGERSTGAGSGDLEFSFGFDRSSTEIDEYGSALYQTVVDGELGESTTLTTRVLGDHTLGAGEIRTAATFTNVDHDESFDGGSSFVYQQRLWSFGAEIELPSAGWFGLGDSGETRWTAGAAVDGASTPRSGDKPPVETLWEWGVRAGATSSAHEGNVLYHAGFSRRTRFPSLRELYSGALGRFEPNPGLSPESLTAFETGITLSRQYGQAQLVGFHHRLSDGIVRTSVDTPTGSRFQRVNRDRVVSTGAELLVSGTSRRFSYGGDLTVQRVRIQDPLVPAGDDRTEYEPTVSGKLTFGVFTPGDFQASAFLRFRGSQFCQNQELGGLDSIDSSTTIDLELRRSFGSGGEGRPSFLGILGLDNVGDTVVFDQCGLPQPGRTLRLQFRVS